MKLCVQIPHVVKGQKAEPYFSFLKTLLKYFLLVPLTLRDLSHVQHEE